jgi:CspA family cold shock protein
MTEETQQSSISEERYTGRVEWFNSRKGYGFINDVNSENSYFVHYDGITVSGNDYKKLFPGEYVSFSLMTAESKTSCVDVRGINNGPLLTENQYNFKVFPKRSFQESGENDQSSERRQ